MPTPAIATRAIILAAGRGRRLGDLTVARPKALLPVAGAPILFYQLSALELHGIKDVTIVVGFEAEAVERYASDSFPNLRPTFVKNELFDHTNTLYSLLLAAEVVPPAETVLQLNGDVIFDPGVLTCLLAAPQHRSAIAVRLGQCGEEEVKVRVTPSGHIAAIGKHIKPADAVGEAVGVNVFAGTFWECLESTLRELADSHRHEYFEFAVESALARGCGSIAAVGIDAFQAIEIDYPADLAVAEESVLPRIAHKF